MKKIITIAIYAILIVLLIVNKATFLSRILSGDELAIIISILFFVLLVFFPAVPFVVAAGIIGASYGFITGTGIILTGVIFGTLVMFLMARYGFQDWAQNMLDKYHKIKQYEIYFQQNAFIGILGLRLLPMIPSPLLNVLCGVSGVRLSVFVAASVLGKLPSIIIFTVAGVKATENTFLAISIYAVYFFMAGWKAKHHQTKISA